MDLVPQNRTSTRSNEILCNNMLKSTYKPSSNISPPLPSGWTEHKAPSGHTYYYNATTQESTYTRPSTVPSPPGLAPTGPAISLSDPHAANTFMRNYNHEHLAYQASLKTQREASRRERESRPKPQPFDKPKRKVSIPGCEPWLLVYTKYGRRFVYNPTKDASYWRIPEKIMKGVIELDIRGVKDKADNVSQDSGKNSPFKNTQEQPAKGKGISAQQEKEKNEDQDSSDYEEIEVTDSEREEENRGSDVDHPSKRQRTEEPADEGPVEFGEDDFAAQIAAMDEYAVDADAYDNNDEANQVDLEHEPELSEEDAVQLFHDLLFDYKISPYSSWDKIIEDGKIIPDSRYLVLSTMKARREAFDAWSRLRIREIKEARASEVRKDPRGSYLQFLLEKAPPGGEGKNKLLYWPEFKRKHRKEEVMRDHSRLSEKEKEKLYRDYIARLKTPVQARQGELTALLKAQPLSILNRGTTVPDNLPSVVCTDVRFVVLDPKIRDPLVQAYVQSLPPASKEGEQKRQRCEVGEVNEMKKAQLDREKRQRALKEREEAVAARKKREQHTLSRERAFLRQEEREVEAAMYIDSRKGLLTQLKQPDLGKEEQL